MALPHVVLPAAHRGRVGQSDGVPGARHAHRGAELHEHARPDTTPCSRGCSSTATTRHSRLRLNNFEATYAANGEASDYVSNVSVFDHGKELETQNIRVNDFLSVDSVNVYQQDYGWAPTIVVTNPAGQTVFDGPIQFFDDPNNIGDKALGDGVLKVPDFDYTIAGASAADPARGARCRSSRTRRCFRQSAATARSNPPPPPTDPAVCRTAQPGDRDAALRRQPRPQQRRAAERQPAQHVQHAAVLQRRPCGADPAGPDACSSRSTPATARASNFTISFPAIHQYSLFQVNDDQGVLLVYTVVHPDHDRAAHQALSPSVPRADAAQTQAGRSRSIRRWSSESSGEPQAGTGPRTRLRLTGLGRQLGDSGRGRGR